MISENPSSSPSLSVPLQLCMLVYSYCILVILSHKKELWFPLLLLPYNMYNNLKKLLFLINSSAVFFYIYRFIWNTYVKEKNFIYYVFVLQ